MLCKMILPLKQHVTNICDTCFSITSLFMAVHGYNWTFSVFVCFITSGEHLETFSFTSPWNSTLSWSFCDHSGCSSILCLLLCHLPLQGMLMFLGGLSWAPAPPLSSHFLGKPIHILIFSEDPGIFRRMRGAPHLWPSLTDSSRCCSEVRTSNLGAPWGCVTSHMLPSSWRVEGLGF